MSSLKNLNTRLASLRTPIAFFSLFAIIGLLTLIATQAATNVTSFEVEKGTLSGCIADVSDAAASDGKTVRFGEGTGCTATNGNIAGAKLPINYDLSALGSTTARYVAPNGSDTTGNGTNQAPYATVAKAYTSAAAGDSIVIRGGVYREGNLTIAANKPIRLLAYPGEIPTFNGAATTSNGWTTDGNLGYRSYSPQPVTDGSGITFTSGQNLNGDQIGKHPDQAWAGDKQLRQVAAKGSVTNDAFWVDTANNRLYVTASNAAQGNMEVSQRDVFLTVNAPETVIKGLRITRFSNSANDYGVVKYAGSADNSVTENVEILDSAFIALSFLGNSDTNNKSTLKNITISRSNWMGINAVYTDDLIVDGLKATGLNQFNEFSHSPQSGAIKTSRTRHTKVLNSDVSNNNSHGIWFDQSNVDVDVANTRIADNTGTGLFFEISDDLLLINSYVRSTGGARAVKLAGSSGLKLVNNTIVGGADPVGVYVDNRSRPGCADPSQPLCDNSYGSDRDTVRPRPATLDWIPRIDLMLNNVIAYPTATGYCGTLTALCITKTNGPATVPLSTVIHKADAIRGIPQTRMDGNIYANGAGKIINTELGNYATTAAFGSAMSGAPIAIGGLEALGHEGNTYVNANGAPTSTLINLYNQAVAVPNDSNINEYLPAGTRRFGALYEIR